jgi:hypothetical protein
MSQILIKNLKDQISQLSFDEVEDKFQLYRNLKSRGVRDEIYLELLAQELDERERNLEGAV